MSSRKQDCGVRRLMRIMLHRPHIDSGHHNAITHSVHTRDARCIQPFLQLDWQCNTAHLDLPHSSLDYSVAH